VLTYLILGVSYGFAAAAQPGQLQAYLVAQTMTNGWRRTLPAACAPLISDAPIICLVLLVLARLPPRLLQSIQLAGGVFLLFLAYGAFKSTVHYSEVRRARAVPARVTFLRAVLLNFLNPNPYVAWTFILGPLLVRAWREAPASGVALVAGFYLTMVVGTGAIVMVMAAARVFGPRIGRVLVAVSAVVLAAFGLYQLWAGSFGARPV
jgi:threonine/homoserine/homoserine lactone efflux protein